MIKKITCKVLKNEKFLNNHVITILSSEPFSHKPGQFINAYVKNNYLGIPLSILRKNEQQIELLVKPIGKGTKILSSLKPGETISIMCPLGSPIKIVKNKKILLVGGGVGLAAILELCEHLQKNNDLEVALCFRTKDDICLVEDFKKICNKVYVSCDEPSQYFHGNIIQLINHNKINFNFYYICGSRRLVMAFEDNYKNIQGLEMIEAPMACGFGICNGCNIILKDGSTRRVCQNCNFMSNTVDFDKLFKG